MARVRARGSLREIFTWPTVSLKLHGELLGSHPGLYGKLGRILTPEGKVVTFAMPAVLKDRLERLSKGTHVWIEYVGDGKTKSGSPVKFFEVEWDNETGYEIDPETEERVGQETEQREAEQPEQEEPEPEDWQSNLPLEEKAVS